HAFCFAKLAYQTAYLKAHYPAEFLAGIMTNQPMGFYPPWVVLNEAKRLGIGVLPPDINRSMARYSVEGGKIRVGLAHLKGMSERAMLSILQARKHRPFRSLRDFCERTNVPRPIVENLIMAGAFREFERAPDSDGERREENRRRLLWDLTMSSHCRGAMNRAPTVPMGPGDMSGTAPVQPPRDWAGQESADASVNGRALAHSPGNGKPRTTEFDFGVLDDFSGQLPDFSEMSDADRTKYDLDLMGITTGRHPIFFIRDRLRERGVVEAARLRDFKDGDPIRVAGMVVTRNRPRTRSGQRVVFVTLEDETGVIEVVIFSNVYDRYGHTIYSCPGLLVEGRLSRQGKLDVAVLAERISPV
ncbi:MAG: OB-fold nucleic acid binding domain-containing protein, partial [Armatimonadota bacterium]